MNKFPSNTELEQGLERIFPEPSEAFTNRLERQLLQQAAHFQQPVQQPRRQTIFPVLKWASVALAVIIIVVLAVGPQNALAAVQKLIGYIPGIGFVENSQQTLRVLAEPMQVEREGVTLTVEKVLASGESTQVRVRVDGLPADKSLFERGWGESQQAMLREEKSGSAGTAGRTLSASSTVSGAGDFVWAEYTFPALAPGVDQVTLLLGRLPGLAAGAAPENWAIEIPLSEVRSGEGLVAATEEPRASQQVNGVRLVLESLAASPDQTALKLRLETDDPLRKPDGLWWQELVLIDDQGKEMPLTHEETLRGNQDGSQVLLAPVLDPERRYSLRLMQYNFEYTFPTFSKSPSVRLPVPDGVQVGQSWAVDRRLEAGGYYLHIIQASLQAREVGGLVFKMTIDPQPGLIGVGLTCQDSKICSSSGFELAKPGQPLETEVYLEQPPGRAIDLKVHTLMEAIQGPWELNFQLDGSR
jgi:hypothetical protein